MADVETFDDPNDPERVSISRDQLAALTQQPAESAETVQLRRENVFLRAGVDMANPNTRFLVSGWPDDAELTVEAARTAAEGLGLLIAQQGQLPQNAPIPAEEREQTDVRTGLAQDSTQPGPPPAVHPSLEAWRIFQHALDNGLGTEEAMARSIEHTVQRVADGTAPQLIIRGGQGDGEAVADIRDRKGHVDVRELVLARQA